ncbi:hypothetical protein Pmar_PMAR009589 [Perkinsus marinus ATCC 50983]|uniref:Uncharacterized protein n=1 Tax=Perkinsus marinus (strain ATCC 50983 / TXsc) TaxID=423536 RepID=C5KEL6_PERM5|nr:hypothetical protein Pmar_PMAR009589 [Perkinsus marinus ATCC 50983]EER17154.1 hypothetical protein Pmar_PMAR009589 [Perkinsus marinus ATCC 50983]|eukprot:XP_002785358.1 hypothetical protein Pmar_PMAR009589 [Perkinsus marinus ATCC 50983]
MARGMLHPDDVEGALPTTLQEAIRTAAKLGLALKEKRAKVMEKIAEVAQELEPLREEWGKKLPVCCEQLHLPLLDYLARLTGYPDRACIDELRAHGGLAFVGPIEAQGIFAAKKPSGRPRKKRKLATKEDVTQYAHRQLAQLESDRVDPSEAEQWMWNQAIAERDMGRLEGPCGVAEMQQWEALGVTRRHVVVQPTKWRPCDNYRGSRVNELVDVRHKVTLPELDTTLQVAREVWRAHGKAVPLSLWKRDHRDAYRQVPINPVESMWSTVVLRDLEGRYQGFKHRVYPFGAVSSSYLDDFYAVEATATAQSGFDAFGELNRLVGMRIKEEKDVACTQKATVLGIEINTEILGTVEWGGGKKACGEAQFRLQRTPREEWTCLCEDPDSGVPEGAYRSGRRPEGCSLWDGEIVGSSRRARDQP